MNVHGSLGLLLVLSAVFFSSTILSRLSLSKRARGLILAGLWLRIVGALGYLYIFSTFYKGGDYNLYFNGGLEYAESLTTGGIQSALQPWIEGRWWGTSFVIRSSGLLLSIIGPTLSGAFITFAVLGYIGILGVWFAFRNAFPEADHERYLAWIVFFPSLWFWPAALGKDALVLCGVGLAAFGFAGNGRRVNWPLLVLGVFLVFCIRPQVAATLSFAIVLSHWLGAGRSWSVFRALQGVFLVAAGIAVIGLSGSLLEVELFNPQEVEAYLDHRATMSARGGSALDGAGGSHSPLLAPINTLLRPFPWEAHGITAMIAAVEVSVLWLLCWYHRRQIRSFIRENRRTPLFWLAVCFTLVYATALGMSISNIGIIARQRVHILPFVFMLFAGKVKVPKRTRSLSVAPGSMVSSSLRV